MKTIIFNIFAIVLGIVIGSAVNMAIVMQSGNIIPLPEGVNPADMESLKSNMHLFEPKHFIMPFLAHALGTLVGAFIASLIAKTRKFTFALVIGFFFLVGGIMNVFMLPSPTWFIIVDLVFAYIPMAYLGYKIYLLIFKK